MLLALLLVACNKDEMTAYDNPFFYTHVQNASEVRVAANRNETVDYKIYFSGKRQFEAITVDYQVVAGDGLIEGVDYEVVSTARSLTFNPGVIEMPIAIRWLPHAIDEAKDNSLTIQITGNSKNYTVGLPGPDALQSALKFIKF